MSTWRGPLRRAEVLTVRTVRGDVVTVELIGLTAMPSRLKVGGDVASASTLARNAIDKPPENCDN